MILSASRRTDIPAFYSDWFMDKIRKGVIKRKNPYNNTIYETKLNPQNINMIVFWTRNAEPMIKKGYIDELIDRGYQFYFQHTITGYTLKSPSGHKLDGRTQNPNKGIDSFNRLADMIGGNKIIWRFDPIVICDQLNIEEILRLYEKISNTITPDCKRNVLSFLDVYDHVGVNMEKYGFTNIKDLTKTKNEQLLNELLKGIKEIANNNQRNVFSCAESINLDKFNIEHSKCIDDDYIRDVFGIKTTKSKDRGQREACGCVKSIDIGEYDTCPHGCVYCYANQKKDLAMKNYKSHNFHSDFIISNRII